MQDPAAAGRAPPAPGAVAPAAQAAAPSNPVHPGPPQPAEPSPHVRTPVAEDQPDSVKLKDKMCSLWSLPYSEQLKVKMCSCWDAMMQLTLEVRQATLQSHQPPWLASILQAHPDGHACCPVDVRTPSPPLCSAHHFQCSQASFCWCQHNCITPVSRCSRCSKSPFVALSIQKMP